MSLLERVHLPVVLLLVKELKLNRRRGGEKSSEMFPGSEEQLLWGAEREKFPKSPNAAAGRCTKADPGGTLAVELSLLGGRRGFPALVYCSCVFSAGGEFQRDVNTRIALVWAWCHFPVLARHRERLVSLCAALPLARCASPGVSLGCLGRPWG